MLKFGAKVMLTINTHINDRLIKGQTGIATHIEFAEGSVSKVYVRFSDNGAGSKLAEIILFRQTKLLDFFWKMLNWNFNKKGSASISIKRTQPSLILAWAATAHNFQGLSLSQILSDFDLWNLKRFGLGQIHTALSRVTAYDSLYCMSKFKKSAIKANEDALQE